MSCRRHLEKSLFAPVTNSLFWGEGAGDREQPSRNGGTAFKAASLLPYIEEHVAQQVLGHGFVAYEPEQPTIDVGPMPGKAPAWRARSPPRYARPRFRQKNIPLPGRKGKPLDWWRIDAKGMRLSGEFVSDVTKRRRGIACPRCHTSMGEIMRIAPLRTEPGLIAYECPTCGKVTSEIWPAGRTTDQSDAP